MACYKCIEKGDNKMIMEHSIERANDFNGCDSHIYSFAKTTDYKDDILIDSDENTEFMGFSSRSGIMEALEICRRYTNLVDYKRPVYFK